MKRLLLALLVLGLAITSCKKEPVDPDPDPVKFSFAATSAEGTGTDQDSEINAKVAITNDEGAAISLKWERTDENLPAGWSAGVCDNTLCYGPAVLNQGFNMATGESFDMKVVFYPGGVSGTGTMNLLVYDPADSLNTVQSIAYSATATK